MRAAQEEERLHHGFLVENTFDSGGGVDVLFRLLRTGRVLPAHLFSYVAQSTRNSSTKSNVHHYSEMWL